ncbi:hypothetical protein [Microbulbifer mangrovi]|uniref:hypothetical protein n=1 Tax=Microbulbifer mangrovi TaxID=927787 RepID=UPI0009903D3A|nr:hypothetical protein [Microbulbifer mangrovi]
MSLGQWHRLKLRYAEHTAEFRAGSENLRPQLHSAFIQLAARAGEVRATLSVHHSLHGWLQVCDPEHRYPIINNPLRLNVSRLWRSVLYTLSEADTWPTDEEKSQRKLERQLKRRAEIAEARRSRFHLVKNTPHSEN